MLGVPVLERKPVIRVLSGHVSCGAGLSQVPSNHAIVTQRKGDRVADDVSIAADGTFVFSTNMEADALYSVKVRSAPIQNVIY